MHRLNLALGGAAEYAQGVWAALWLCSIEKLEKYVVAIEHGPDTFVVTSLYTTVVVTDIIKPWMTGRARRDVESSVPGTPVSGAASPASPSTQCFERDGERCIITKVGGCSESAHIYPYSLHEGFGPKCARFWDTLSMLWPPSTIEEWKADVFGGSNTELCSNRITLSANAHVYWGKGLFALKPVSMSEDKKTLQLEFHWLRQVPQSSSTVLLSDKPSFEESLDGSGKNARLQDFEKGELISSGHKIWMKTDDPINRPLPSVKLLGLQWALQRLASLSGAAAAFDVLLDSDDEENDGMVRLYDSEEDFC
ncbi:HNH endonuclease signature motif containing protein [Aspergillus fischeri NRRL 181]|uniref:HNH nuclease domain-containing protein n=1 Tax=Neosartorya fischeri (strain ATCC 1020 / DSM 3700 / CBS 544.65 / FGSC A1164 / JCM 1740 / NRRL 181 / WB 181) TaxID=331117 RepID=A1DGB9_NEOFI|nr:uncharacterized protein NFIA_083780 [Aspergillus fischeri NRRL 181]EAW18426.1 hypothetical protein NFIA_083780 [Aspergillus fischeri NRRL 181]